MAPITLCISIANGVGLVNLTEDTERELSFHLCSSFFTSFYLLPSHLRYPYRSVPFPSPSSSVLSCFHLLFHSTPPPQPHFPASALVLLLLLLLSVVKQSSYSVILILLSLFLLIFLSASSSDLLLPTSFSSWRYICQAPNLRRATLVCTTCQEPYDFRSLNQQHTPNMMRKTGGISSSETAMNGLQSSQHGRFVSYKITTKRPI